MQVTLFSRYSSHYTLFLHFFPLSNTHGFTNILKSMPNMITNNTRQRLSMLGLAFLLSTFTFALANPLHLREPGVLFVRRDDNSGPTTVWVRHSRFLYQAVQ